MTGMTAQHPAAPEPETDANGLTEAIECGLRKCRMEDAPVSLIKEHDLFHVTHMVAAEVAPILDAARERVRVVEGERDAARVSWESACGRADLWIARAESAEAAHEAEKAAHERLRAEVGALADRWACAQPDRQMPGALHRAACFSCSHADRLRALLAGGGER